MNLVISKSNMSKNKRLQFHTLWEEMWVFISLPKIKYLGQIFYKSGRQPEPLKAERIENMHPTN